jgi:RNA polymerase sigma-70 factor (ECF subfamily)
VIMLARHPAAGSPDVDQALVDRARRGDQDAVRLLVDQYQRRVVGLAWGLLGNRSDAEDAAQDAFLRAFRSLRTFKGRSSFRTWLFQIAINTARTFRRTREGRPEDSVGGAAEFDATAAAGQLEQQVVARDQVRRAMGTLPADLREAVVLRDINGLDYREIAEMLDIPIGTVMSRLHRGRKAMQRALYDYAKARGLTTTFDQQHSDD